MLRWLRYQIRNYFAFNRKETNGTIILIVVMVLLLAAPFFYSSYLDSHGYVASQADKKMLDSLVAVLESGNNSTKVNYQAEAQKSPIKITLFAFDPNRATVSELQQLGVPARLAERISNYRSKGGRFRIKQDLMKVYGFPEPLFVELKPHITLPDTLARASRKPYPTPDTAAPKRSYNKASYEPAAFDLNEADTTALKRLKGIGSGFSRRIILYRAKLGGFVDAAQVREIYGLEEEVADEVLRYGMVKAGFVPVQIDINIATVDELKVHPYISSSLARLIVGYRKQHGRYNSVEDLRNIKILKEEDFVKLKPYLKVE
jgi:competence protein ComEA